MTYIFFFLKAIKIHDKKVTKNQFNGWNSIKKKSVECNNIVPYLKLFIMLKMISIHQQKNVKNHNTT